MMYLARTNTDSGWLEERLQSVELCCSSSQCWSGENVLKKIWTMLKQNASALLLSNNRKMGPSLRLVANSLQSTILNNILMGNLAIQSRSNFLMRSCVNMVASVNLQCLLTACFCVIFSCIR